MFSDFEFVLEMTALFGGIFAGLILGCFYYNKAKEKKNLDHMQTEEKNQEVRDIKKKELKKNNTLFAAAVYLLCILVMVGATCFMYKDKIKMKYVEHKITKSVKKTYDIDKLYDVSIVKLDDVAFEFRNYEDFDYDENGEYYKMFFACKREREHLW